MTQTQIYPGIFENKKWIIEYPENGGRNVREILTEKEILETYYPYWSTRMFEIGKLPMITERNCILDWIVVHWAYEL